MGNESIAMPSVSSTLTQHGGPQAAMPASSSVAGGHDVAEQKGVESAAKASQEPPTHIKTVKPSIDKAYIEKQAQELQEKLTSLGKLKGWAIHFSLVPEFDRPVIQVIDAETRQVIRQIPSEEILQMNKRLQEMGKNQGDGSGLSGLLFDGQV